MEFFQGFNFDTLLALISCATGIIALFLGGTAYKNCKINKSTLTQKKKFDDGSADNSISVGGDYTHNDGISETGLITVMDKMKDMTSVSFSTALDSAYTMFQAKCDENLHQIINETQKIVSEQKLNISGYSKLDWIHFYFESAKNTSDTYMQQVWAKVLAKELSTPDSFSYKTLDALKNMSENEFKLFEKLIAINVSGAIVNGDYLDGCGLNWMVLQKLKEYGLISLDDSQRTIDVEANGTAIQINGTAIQIISNQYLILFKNNKSTRLKTVIQCYLLTNVAKELLSIVAEITPVSSAIDIVSEIRKVAKEEDCFVSLHKINYFYNNGENFNYNKTDIMPNTDDVNIAE